MVCFIQIQTQSTATNSRQTSSTPTPANRRPSSASAAWETWRTTPAWSRASATFPRPLEQPVRHQRRHERVRAQCRSSDQHQRPGKSQASPSARRFATPRALQLVQRNAQERSVALTFRARRISRRRINVERDRRFRPAIYKTVFCSGGNNNHIIFLQAWALITHFSAQFTIAIRSCSCSLFSCASAFEPVSSPGSNVIIAVWLRSVVCRTSNQSFALSTLLKFTQQYRERPPLRIFN